MKIRTASKIYSISNGSHATIIFPAKVETHCQYLRYFALKSKLMYVCVVTFNNASDYQTTNPNFILLYKLCCYTCFVFFLP